MPRGSKQLLDPAEEVHDLRAIDPLEQARAEPPVAVLAGGRAAQRDHASTSPRRAARRRPRSHPGRRDVGQQVHVDVAVAGVAEDHRREYRAMRQPAAPREM